MITWLFLLLVRFFSFYLDYAMPTLPSISLAMEKKKSIHLVYVKAASKKPGHVT